MNFITVGVTKKMSLNHHQYLDNGVSQRRGVVIRSQWHASAEEPGEGLTQLAAHGIADGKSVSQFWRAGDVGSIRSTAGLPISMAEFDNRRTVTVII